MEEKPSWGHDQKPGLGKRFQYFCMERGSCADSEPCDGFGMHTRHDTVEYISPRGLEEGSKTLCTAAAWAANEPHFSFLREIPEEMQRELEKYFA